MEPPEAVTEIGDIRVKPGTERDFVHAYRSVRHVLAGTPGCRSVLMTQSRETPSRFVLVVEWESVEAHLQNFRSTDRFHEWRAAIGPFFAEPPLVEHVRSVEG